MHYKDNSSSVAILECVVIENTFKWDLFVLCRQAQASGGVELQASTVSKSDEDNRSQSDSSDTQSNLSSLGPWGDDPEIQEKVR